MDKNVKKVIAREGLIFIVVFVTATLISFIGLTVENLAICFSTDMDKVEGIERFGRVIEAFTFYTFVVTYPLYIITRFVLWALRTLKD